MDGIWTILVVLILQTIPSVAQEKSEPSEILPVIKMPSSVGEVTFPHQEHSEEFEIECKTCHHEINASELKTPHEKYLVDFWIDCKICHRAPDPMKPAEQACSNCHHVRSTANIADETLSAKVVIHQSCWECHEVGTGAKASKNCSFCHVGPRMESTDEDRQ